MKKQLLNLRFGNRAFMFSMDAVIAIMVVASLMLVSTFYIIKAGDELTPNLQAVRIGYDVLALLDYRGILDTLSAENIEIELNEMLPINYHMRVNVNCVNQGAITVETTDVFPKDRFIGTGKRVFVTNTSKECIADFSVWLR